LGREGCGVAEGVAPADALAALKLLDQQTDTDAPATIAADLANHPAPADGRMANTEMTNASQKIAENVVLLAFARVSMSLAISIICALFWLYNR
jgi:hypothetical protein